MKKRYIEIKIKNKVVAVCAIKECDPVDFIKLQNEAETNLNELLNKIENLEKDVKILKGED